MNRGAVLCFHSVTTASLPGEGAAHVSAAAFKSFVRAARLIGEIVPLSELVRRHRQGLDNGGLIAVTFDDAYAAVLSELEEFISSHAVPVTMFVATDAASAGAKFWWDRIDDLFPRVPSARWRAFEDSCGLPDSYRRGQPANDGPLRPLRQWLLAAHAGRWPEALEPALQTLETEFSYQTVHRSMTFDELTTLASLPAVELGVHTASHPVLPLLGDDELRFEIETAHEVLRERFTNVLPVLAVPFGLYDQRMLHIARASGMSASLTLAGTMNASLHDCGVPRVCMTSGDTALRLGLRLLGVNDMVRRWSGRSIPRYPDLPSPTT
jgi:peptidoglycan/xylan/chitin deacetylase (PgdA/CDA1 family)